jgi:hypothetical protein
MSGVLYIVCYLPISQIEVKEDTAGSVRKRRRVLFRLPQIQTLKKGNTPMKRLGKNTGIARFERKGAEAAVGGGIRIRRSSR